LHHPSDTTDLAIVGGGVIGLATAWRAAQAGMRVSLFERHNPGAATSAIAAGMLAPVSEAHMTERPLLALGLDSAALYPSFLDEVEQETGMDCGRITAGTLLVARDQDDAEWLQRELALRLELRLPVERLLPSDARGLEPSLAPGLRMALGFPHDHAVDPRKLTAALAVVAAKAGARLRPGSEIVRIVVRSGRACGVELADGERVQAGNVLVAAGPWASELAGVPDDARIPIHPVKGQILRLRDPNGPGLLTRVLRVRTSYVVPRGDGRYVLGATMEERGYDTTVTAGAAFELLRDGTEIVPGLDELVIEEFSAGLRPATRDNAPAIGPSHIPGLHWAVGHFRNGILLAPVTAQLLVRALTGESDPRLQAFSPARLLAPAQSMTGAAFAATR
jgi:glycine oxidase